MARKAKADESQLALLDTRERATTAPCVPGIRTKVKAWRDARYDGITDTTRILLNHWFDTDHRVPGSWKM